MTIVFMIMLALVAQVALNFYSTKRGYGIGRKAQVVAAVANVFLLVSYQVKFGYSTDILLVSLATCILVSAFFVDFKHYIIPNGYNLGLFILAILYLLNNLEFWSELVKGGAFFFGTFLLLLLLTGGRLGGGDVKMSISLGIFLGASSFMSYMVVTFLTCALISAILLILKVKKGNDNIAFGPYMIIGFIWLLPW